MLPAVKEASKQFQAICFRKYELRQKFYDLFAGLGLSRHDDEAIGEFLVSHPEIRLTALAPSFEDQLKAEAIQQEKKRLAEKAHYENYFEEVRRASGESLKGI